MTPALILLALLVGILLGPLGGGGAILTVPILAYLVHQPPSAATTGSLVIVGLSSVVGLLPHLRAGRVRVVEGVTFGLLGIVESLMGSRLSTAIPGPILMTSFSLLLLPVATLMLRRHRRCGATSGTTSPRGWPTRVAAATGVGLLIGFFGVGGGFVVVPALSLAVGLPMGAAVGTSLLVIAINAAGSLAARATAGLQVDWGIILPFAAATVVDTLAGGRIGQMVDQRTLPLAFIAPLVLVAGYVTVRNIPQLFKHTPRGYVLTWWLPNWRSHPVKRESSVPLTIAPIETSSLDDRSYLVHDGHVAYVVDPQRDIDRVQDLARTHGVQITDVFERTPIRDGDVVQVGQMRVRAIHTPGHTLTHLSYALEGDEPAVFSGGSLLFGSTGRPDLLGREHADELARHQHHSAHRLATELTDDTQVMPTHGFGSFCSATQSDADASTIGKEKATNPALTQDEETYVREILDGLDLFPAYYAHMGPANAAGPDGPDLSAPAPAEKAELRRRLEAGEWLVDLRTRTAFAAGHAPGTVNFGLDGQFSTHLGWMIPWGATRPLAALPAPPLPTSPRCGTTGSRPASPTCPRARCGCTAPAATAPRSPHPSSPRTGATSSRSTTPSTTPVGPACRWPTEPTPAIRLRPSHHTTSRSSTP